MSLLNEKSGCPQVSIITVVYNGADCIEKTIESVLGQTYENIEYIIIDGGSTDKTLSIIKRHEDRIDQWISEPDHGIYDAMNKGIELASGEWLNFMNSGDCFVDNEVLSRTRPYLNNDSVSFIYGDTVICKDRYRIYRKCDRNHVNLVHQSCIYRKSLHTQYGKYLVHQNVSTADYIFFNLIPKEQFIKTPFPIGEFVAGGISSTRNSFYQKISLDFVFGHKSKVYLLAIFLLYPVYKPLKYFLIKAAILLGLYRCKPRTDHFL